MQSPIPRHWRYGVLSLALTLASMSVLLPTLYLASVSSTAETARDFAQQMEAARHGRTVQRGGRGTIQPLRQQRRAMMGISRRVRTKPFGRGALPELSTVQKRFIQRRSKVPLSLRQPEVFEE